jgi:hypothetical protein
MRKKNLKNVTFVLAVVFILAAVLAAVIRKPQGEVKEHPHYKADILPVFQNNCTLSGCHDAAGTAGLILLPEEAYSDLVGVKSLNEPEFIRVEPGDAENSYLIIKMEDRQSVGAHMPRGSGPLSDETIQTIKNWIDQGAEKGH